MRLPRRPPRAPRLAPSPRPRFTERQGRRRGCGKRVLPAVLIPSAPSTRPGGESLGPGRRLPGHPGSSRPSAFKSLECAAPHPAPTTITTARQRKAKLNPEAAAQRRQTASTGRRESRRGRGDAGPSRTAGGAGTGAAAVGTGQVLRRWKRQRLQEQPKGTRSPCWRDGRPRVHGSVVHSRGTETAHVSVHG